MSEDGRKLGAIVVVMIFAVRINQLMGSVLVRILNKGVSIGRIKIRGLCRHLILPPLVTYI
jgi:hypothetical protein